MPVLPPVLWRKSILVSVKLSLFIRIFLCLCMVKRDTQWHSWLSYCAKSQKFAGSIPDGVIGIFHWNNPSSRTMALRSTQPLTETSTRIIFWGKGGRCIGLTTLPPSCADCLEIWKPQPPGTLWASPGLYRDCLPFICDTEFMGRIRRNWL
jgi:hypothetical protein